MSAPLPTDAEVSYLASPGAIRERSEALYALGLSDGLEAWRVNESQLPDVVERVLAVTRAAYPDVRQIPYHSRWRHFSAGGVDRVGRLDALLSTASPAERLATRFELVITSVLLDAGAGERWGYREGDVRYSRSEGLAVASYDLFVTGGLSSDSRAPLAADAGALESLEAATLSEAFQVTSDNPLLGLEGRVALLRSLGRAVLASPEYFGTEPRLGSLGAYLVRKARGGELRAAVVLETVLDALGPIWPGRELVRGRSLGDVWSHPAVGRVPFHKLSQWLTYSLCEPLEAAGLRVVGLEELTGLAEYRNGGLFVDSGVLVPKRDSVLADVHDVSSPTIVEWRALTVALLDRTASSVRARLGLTEPELPLAKVLEGGTWRAGREIAREKRREGGPPVRVRSDGTVF